jgi:hypothetical protein
MSSEPKPAPAEHALTVTAKLFQKNARTSMSLVQNIGAYEDDKVQLVVALSGLQIELWHPDGRQITINLHDMVDKAHGLFKE